MKDCQGFDEVVRMIGGKWKLMILRQLIYNGVIRFNELRRSIKGISQTMLTKQLRELEQDDLLMRRVFAEVPPRVEYTATAKAKDLDQMFSAMYAWAKRH
ncbi:MAG: winged helix-turn-helix transcriptional regulator [Thiohalomonadales bacterium]